MGKAKRKRTPSATRRKVLKYPAPPGLAEAIRQIDQRWAKAKPDAAKLAADRRMLDRMLAQDFGRQPIKPPERTGKGKKFRRVLQVLPDLYPQYPPHDIPVTTVKLDQEINKEFKKRDWGQVSRTVIERATGRRKAE